MATHLIGQYKYEDYYVIDADGDLFGPFLGLVKAHTFALERIDPPYTVRLLLSPKEAPEQKAAS